MADSLILLVAPPSGAGAALRDRLLAMGFRCEVLDASTIPRGWSDARPDLLLIADAGGFAPAASAILGRRGGTPLEGLPVIVFGALPGLPAGPEYAVDERVPVDAPDDLLAARLGVWCRWGERARRLRDVEERIREAQDHDGLTGVLGHRALQERLEVEVKRSRRYTIPLALAFGDVDRMREVNERYGHRTGDRVLCEVAQTLRRGVREVDVVARFEGDCFAIVLPQAGAEAAARVVARLRSLVASQIFRGEGSGTGPLPLLKISMVFGFACLPDPALDGRNAFIAAATAALERERGARRSPSVPA